MATAASSADLAMIQQLAQKPPPVGGKHAVVWKRMKEKNATKIVAPTPRTAALQDQGIPMAVTLEEEEEEDDEVNDEYNDPTNTSAWAMMDLDQTLPMDLLLQDPSLLGSSFLSTSSTGWDDSPPRDPHLRKWLRKNALPESLEIGIDETLDCNHHHIEATASEEPTKQRTVPSPPSSMLERNQTLVKEVKFAEQTCVELSQKNISLETSMKRIEAELETWKSSTEKVQTELIMSHRDNATLQAQKEGLEHQLAVLKDSMQIQVETLETKNKALETELADLKETMKYTDLSTLESRTNIGSPTSRVLARTLESELAREHAVTDRVMELERQLSDTTQGVSLEGWKQLTKEKDALLAQVAMLTGMESVIPPSKIEIDLEEELIKVHRKCHVYEQEARDARAEVERTKHQLQEEFYEMTASTLVAIDLQTKRIQDVFNAKISVANDRLLRMTHLVDFLKESLDFQSESGSANGVSHSNNGDTFSPDFDAVLDATFHKPSLSSRLFDDEEQIIKQMEEARLNFSESNEAIWYEDSTFEGAILEPLGEHINSRETLSMQAIRQPASDLGSMDGSVYIQVSDEMEKSKTEKYGTDLEASQQAVKHLTLKVNQLTNENESVLKRLQTAKDDLECAQQKIQWSKPMMEKSDHILAMMEIENTIVNEKENNSLCQSLGIRQANISPRNEIHFANKSFAEKVNPLHQIDKERMIVDESKAVVPSLSSDLVLQGKSKISLLERQLKEMNEMKDDLILKNERISAQWNEDIAAKKILMRQLKEHKQKADFMTSSQDWMKRRIKELHDALINSQNDLEQLKSSYVSCNDKLVAAMEWASKQNAMSEKYKMHFETAMLASNDGEIEAVTLQGVVDALQRTNEEHQASIEKLKVDLQLKRETQKATAVVIAELKTERDQFHDQCKVIQVSLAQETKACEALNSELCNQNLKIAGLHSALSEQQAISESYKLQYETALKTNIEGRIEDTTRKSVSEDLKRTNEDLISSIESLKENLNVERERQKANREVITALETEHVQLLDECRQVQVALAQETKISEALKAELQSQNGKLTKLHSALSTMEQDAKVQVSTRDSIINELKVIIVDYASREEKQISKENDVRVHINSLNDDIERLKFSYVSCNDKLAATSERNDERQAQIDQLNATMKVERERQKANREVITALETEHVQLLDECRQVQVALAQETKISEALKAELQSQNGKLTELHAALSTMEQDVKVQVSTRDSTINELKMIIVDYASREEKQILKENEMCVQINSLNDDIERLKFSYVSCNDKLAATSERNDERQAQIDQLNATMKVERERQKANREVITALETEHAQLLDECRQVQVTLAQETKISEALKAELQSQNGKLTELHATLSTMEQDAKVQVSTRDSTINELKMIIVDYASREEKQILKENELCVQINSLNDDIERLKFSYVSCNDKLAATSERNDERQAQIDQLIAAIKFTEERCIKYSDELGETLQKLEKVEMEKTDFENRLSRAENELKFQTDRFSGYQETVDNLKSSWSTSARLVEDELATLKLAHGNDVCQTTETLIRFTNELTDASFLTFKSLRQAGVVSSRKIPQILQAGGDSNASRWKRILADASEELVILKDLVVTSCDTLNSQTEKIQELEALVQTTDRDLKRQHDSKEQLEFDLLREKSRVVELTDQLREAGEELIRAVSERDGIGRKLSETNDGSNKQGHVHIESTIKTLEGERDLALQNEIKASSLVAFLTEKLEKSARILSTLETKLDETEAMLEEQGATSLDLHTQNNVLEHKCSRYREYIQKLTAKCDEWASSYAKQARAIHQRIQSPMSSTGNGTPYDRF